MVRAVLTSTVKPFLMSPFVRPANTPMELAVPGVIASMLIVIVMGKSRRNRH